MNSSTILFVISLLSFVIFGFCQYSISSMITKVDGSFSAVLKLESNPSSKLYGSNASYLDVDVEYISLATPSLADLYTDTDTVYNSAVKVSISTTDWNCFSTPKEVFALEGGEQAYDGSQPHALLIEPPDISDEYFTFSLYQRGNSTLHTIDAPLFTFGGEDEETEIVFQDSYIQFSYTPSPSPDGDVAMFGLGNRRTDFRRKAGTYPIINKQPIAALREGVNGYTNHPVTWHLSDTSAYNVFMPVTATGAFFANTTLSEFELTDSGSIIVRGMSGQIVMYFFAGPTMFKASQQYQLLVGLPVSVTINQLGWQNCRWGYSDIEEVWGVVQQYRSLDLPLDVQWLDIDAQDDYAAYTVDPVNFPPDELQPFQENLAADYIELVAIFDPGIKVDDSGDYDAYDDILSMDIALKVDEDGVGERYAQNSVWGGPSLFPSFYNEDSLTWVQTQLGNYFENNVQLQGIWNDMCEPATMVDGECDSDGKKYEPTYADSLIYSYDPDDPPFRPGTRPLNESSLTMNAYTPYFFADTNRPAGMVDLRNVFGMYMSVRTREALDALLPSESKTLMLTRSSFSGSGKYTSQWLGDNYCLFNNLEDSFGEVLTSSLHGIPLIGADIPGFSGIPSRDLFKRWVVAGSYYPFTRVHAMKPFDHVCWKEEYGSDACDIQRESALTKYRMIALMYSEMLKAHVQGGSIVRPLQADWPQLTALYDTDQVFSYGGYLIGAPLVHSEMSGTTVITLPYETYSPISTV
ncbi:Glycoside hydrolase family 31 like protein, partial [Aduncisulcus paluster]